ncbi:FabG-like short-chain dehydrogenase/reductase [Ligilactobacillus salitolerans]|uniref:FabG-like short-chain dehydrogenase/reductase n=1 Tax=Ligilactobacillus salitolerans TaxID=1808352 RepID=A0A401IR94_9LACO|nr:SDR family oxidoreductase [Ligilactobacillus salitolerans]GBG94052.1 FabG-like short-chain dehydrogenase/reductase [Ligilactobacillus salitolerans]
MAQKFENEVVLITGAATGIGKETALQFANEGAKIVIGDVNDAAADVAQSINDNGEEATYVKTDVTNEDDVKALVEAVISKYGRLDHVFNNAGFLTPPAKLADIETAIFDKTIAVDVRGVFLCMKYEIPEMLKKHAGTIVNTASVAGLVADPVMSPYVAAKHAVVGLTEAAGLDYGKDGIRVNALAPGLTDTPMTKGWKDEPAVWQEKLDNIPTGTAGMPEDQAAMVLFLSSPEAKFCNMQTFTVDGGQTKH